MRIYFLENSISKKVMSIAYMIAPCPSRYIAYFDNPSRNVAYAVRRLCRDEYLEKKKVDGKNYLFLGKKKCEEPFKNASLFYNANRNRTWQLADSKKKNQRNRRNANMALALAVMVGSGAEVIPGIKPAFGEPCSPGRYYYTAMELKENNSIGLRESRATGFLFNKTEGYLIYGQNIKTVSLNASAELKQWLYCTQTGRKMIGGPLFLRKKKAMIISEKDRFIENVLRKKDNEFDYLMFDEIYFFNVRKNKRHIKLFLDGRLKTEDKQGIVFDYEDEDGLHFKFYEPNIMRLRQVVNYAKQQGCPFVIDCFDFQAETLSKALEGIASVNPCTLEDFLGGKA